MPQRRVFAALALTLGLTASEASAMLYLTGSISTSTSNVPFQTYESRYGSGSIGVDLGRYIRLQFTHSQEFSVSRGYKDPNASTTTSSSAATGSATADSCASCIETHSSTHVIGNSVDLQVILYEGQVFVPYLTGGGIVKQYRFRTLENDNYSDNRFSAGPVPNLGAGIGLRLNKDFTLKLSYLASPGFAQLKGETEPRHVWDKKVTLGLTYQI